MAGAPGSLVRLTGTGDVTYRSGGRARYDLSQLASLVGAGPRTPYVRKLVIHADVNFVNGNVGSQTINWQRLYDAIKRIALQIQGHMFVDCPYTGGQALRVLNFLMSGRRPEGPGTSTTGGPMGDLTVGGSSNSTVQIKFEIPCYDPRATSPEDDMIPAQLLLGGSLELDWAAGSTEFGANFSFGAASSIRSVTAEIILRDEVRVPALWVIQERNQSALSDFIAPDGVLYTDIVLEPVHATGQTTTFISNANVTQLTLTQNGLKTIDGVAPADVIALFNGSVPQASEGYIAQPESGNCEFVPLFWNPRTSGKTTHAVPELSKPLLVITGTLSTSSARLLLRYKKPNGVATVAAAFAKMGTRVPPDFSSNPGKYLGAKTASKADVAATKARFLPIKLYRAGA